ncbi:hypothetical protein HYU17_02100 [Candidatus Woesearchaeota archaeon]|nr:hypothetical protein [Candidatus Woesearchaeota archaeon]
MLSYVVILCEGALIKAKTQPKEQEVIGMEEGLDDFYETFESELEDDEISAWEEGFMMGFTGELSAEEQPE